MAKIGELVLKRIAEWVQQGSVYVDREIATQEAVRSLGIWDAEVYEATFSDDDRAMSFFAHDGSDIIYDMYLRGELRKDKRVKVIVVPQEEE